MTTRFTDHLLTGDHASRPAFGDVPQGTLYSCTTHGLIYQSDGSSAWSTWLTLPATGAVATDSIWDAAGDLAVGTGADTAAKLTKGAAGGALSMINAAVAWNSGTSNPGSAVAGDRYWRTDLGLEVYYDGTRWLTQQMFTAPLPQITNVSADPAATGALCPSALFQVYVVAVRATTLVLTTNDGTKYWTVQFNTQKAPNTATNLGSSFNTSADTATSWTTHTVAVGATVATSELTFNYVITKTSTPGGLYMAATVFYRLVIT